MNGVGLNSIVVNSALVGITSLEVLVLVVAQIHQMLRNQPKKLSTMSGSCSSDSQHGQSVLGGNFSRPSFLLLAWLYDTMAKTRRNGAIHLPWCNTTVSFNVLTAIASLLVWLYFDFNQLSDILMRHQDCQDDGKGDIKCQDDGKLTVRSPLMLDVMSVISIKEEAADHDIDLHFV